MGEFVFIRGQGELGKTRRWIHPFQNRADDRKQITVRSVGNYRNVRMEDSPLIEMESSCFDFSSFFFILVHWKLWLMLQFSLFPIHSLDLLHPPPPPIFVADSLLRSFMDGAHMQIKASFEKLICIATVILFISGDRLNPIATKPFFFIWKMLCKNSTLKQFASTSRQDKWKIICSEASYFWIESAYSINI